jgi:transcriptional antiterminator NusG
MGGPSNRSKPKDGKDFEPGDKVRAKDGPFSEFVGVVTEITPDWVEIEMDIHGRSTPVALRPEELERVE